MNMFGKMKTLFVDPVEDGVCVIRTMGIIGASAWAWGAWKIVTSGHPDLMSLGESLGVTVSSIGAAIRIKTRSKP